MSTARARLSSEPAEFYDPKVLKERLDLTAAHEPEHVQGGQEFHRDAIKGRVGAWWVDTDYLTPAFEKKMIGLLGKAAVVGSVDVEIDDVTRGKRGGFLALKKDAA
jgi:hypothetical protein